ncbi:Nuclear Rna Export Factor 3 [Manis pentadactyla]|nr:Nuclear Rna Export Factor 3 [Manis pentadactyla]
MEGKSQYEASGNWFKIEFDCVKMQAQFFVENASIAFSLKMPMARFGLMIMKGPSVFTTDKYLCEAPGGPHSLQKELKTEKVGHIKLFPLKLSNKKPQQLNVLSNTMLKTSSIKNLNLSSNEVKSAGLLNKGKGLEPEEMRDDSKPLCTTVPGWEALGCAPVLRVLAPMRTTVLQFHSLFGFVLTGSSILQLFPRLLLLDGQDSRPPTIPGIEARKMLPRCMLLHDL